MAGLSAPAPLPRTKGTKGLGRSGRAREKGLRNRRPQEEGQQATAAGLDLLRVLGWLVLHDVAVPAGADGVPETKFADHLLAGPSGVYVVNTVTWSGAITTTDDTLTVGKEDRAAALAEVNDVAESVRGVLHGMPVAPMLCFERLEQVTGVVADVALCASENILDLLTGQPTILDPAAFARASRMVGSVCRADARKSGATLEPLPASAASGASASPADTPRSVSDVVTAPESTEFAPAQAPVELADQVGLDEPAAAVASAEDITRVAAFERLMDSTPGPLEAETMDQPVLDAVASEPMVSDATVPADPRADPPAEAVGGLVAESVEAPAAEVVAVDVEEAVLEAELWERDVEEDRVRVAVERASKEARDQKVREALERIEQEAKRLAEQEIQELAEREARRLAEREAQERAERERVEAARLKTERLDAERLERERAERERAEAARLEQERLEQERLEQERAEAERLEQEGMERERAEAGRLEQARLEQARLEQACFEQERAEQERLEQERAEQERAEAERLEQERAEQERAEQERAEQERAEAERLEQEHAEQERAEQERAEQERAEAERLAQERAEQERAEAERLEQERAEQERAEAERLEQEHAEQERAEQERAEQERAEQERAEAERLAQERAEQERAEAERAEAERLQQDRRAPEHDASESFAVEPEPGAEPDDDDVQARADRVAAIREREAQRARERAEVEGAEKTPSRTAQADAGPEHESARRSSPDPKSTNSPVQADDDSGTRGPRARLLLRAMVAALIVGVVIVGAPRVPDAMSSARGLLGDSATAVGTSVSVKASASHPDVTLLAGTPVDARATGGFRPPKGQHLVAVPLRLTNSGLARWDVLLATAATAVDSSGAQAPLAATVPGLQGLPMLSAQTKVGPGKVVTGYVVFSVPKGQGLRSVSLALSTTGNDTVTWTVTP